MRVEPLANGISALIKRSSYANKNKSNRERQILYDITYMGNLKTDKLVNMTKHKADSQIKTN